MAALRMLSNAEKENPIRISEGPVKNLTTGTTKKGLSDPSASNTVLLEVPGPQKGGAERAPKKGRNALGDITNKSSATTQAAPTVKAPKTKKAAVTAVDDPIEVYNRGPTIDPYRFERDSDFDTAAFKASMPEIYMPGEEEDLLRGRAALQKSIAAQPAPTYDLDEFDAPPPRQKLSFEDEDEEIEIPDFV